MASKKAIELATAYWTDPNGIFFYDGDDTCLDTFLVIIQNRESNAFELIESGAKMIGLMTDLELMLDAFRYWQEMNSDKVRLWESANPTPLHKSYWAGIKLLEMSLERTLQQYKKITEELKTTNVRMY